MKIGILGSGEVAKALGTGFLRHGHPVMLGSRDPEKVKAWAGASGTGRVGTFAEAAAFGELLVLAVKGTVAEQALELAGVDKLADKPIIDTTNPIADAPPENGVLRFFTDLNGSLLERLQSRFPKALLVKAFNSVGSACMVDPAFEGGRPTMFICGADAGAKTTVSGILQDVGWEVADMGGPEAARAIEPLCMLWCIRGFRDNQWRHAFKLLK